MTIRLKLKCPLCGFNRYIKSDEDLNPDFTGFPSPDLPEIEVDYTTSKGNKGIQHHVTPLEEFHGGDGRTEQIEGEILSNLKTRCDSISSLLEIRMQEI